MHFPEKYICERVIRATLDITYKFLPWHPEWRQHALFKKWRIIHGETKRGTKIARPPNLRPLRKLHKPGNTWRRVVNASKWHSVFISAALGDELELMIAALQRITNERVILENSFELINIYHSLNADPTKGTTYNHAHRVFLDFDVKAMYNVIDLEQTISVLLWLNDRFLSWDKNRFAFVIECIRYFAHHSFIRYEDDIFRVIKGVGMGYSHSMNIANITLLGFEIVKLAPMRAALRAPPSMRWVIFIIIFKRYVDDLKCMIDIYKDETVKLQEPIEVAITSIKSLYPPNIELTVEHGLSAVYMDTESYINPRTLSIHSKIYEKSLNKHIYLHSTANNPKAQKSSIFASMLFRSICLNDSQWEHSEFSARFLKRIQLRGYAPWFIRLLRKHGQLPRYERRQHYLKGIDMKRDLKWRRSCLRAHGRVAYHRRYMTIAEECELRESIEALEREINKEEDKELIFFKKTYQQTIDCDVRMRSILRSYMMAFPAQFREQVRICVCDKAGDKICLYLS